MRSRLLLTLLAVSLAGGLLPVQCTRTPQLEVQAATARRAPLRVEVATNGSVEPVDDVEMRARLDGRIVDIPDDPGQRVAAGEEVVRFDAAPVLAELASVESERLAALEALRGAQAAAAQARARAAVDATLYEKGGLTRQAHEAAETALREAEAQLAYQQREVPLRIAGYDLRIKDLKEQREATVVRAPFSGTIYKVQAKRGETVHMGASLLALADLEHLRVRANVDQVDLGRVQPGQRVAVSANAFPDRSWTGVISEVVPHVVVKESRWVSEGLARLDPPTSGLVPGMIVDVDIIVAEQPNALQVPAPAIFYRDGEPFVFRIEGDRVRATGVKLGLSSVSATEITEGLADGALVVTVPPPGLEDGMRVAVRRTDTAKT